MEWIDEGESYAVSAVKNVMIWFFRKEPTAEIIRRRVPWATRTLKQHESFSELVVVTADALPALPNREFHTETKRQMALFQGKIRCVATVVEGDHFAQTLVRTFLRGQTMLSRHSIEFRTFDAVSSAALWLSKEAGTTNSGATAAELTFAARTVRERFVKLT